MTPFISIAPHFQGIIGVIFLASFFVVAGHVIAALWINHSNRIVFICELIIVYFCFQCCASIIEGPQKHGEYSWLVKVFGEIPWLALVVLGITILIVNSVLLYGQSRWKFSNISLHSIKQAVDKLPVGICYYDQHGLLLLKNHIMEEVAFELMGERLFNGRRLREKIEKDDLPQGFDREMIQDNLALIFPDGRVFSCYFSEENKDKKVPKSILITDITDEYNSTKCLQKQKEELEKANQRLVEYNREITKIISQKEILSAKIKIHDELGITLLESKHYLLNGGNEEKKKEIIQGYQRNIKCLLQENDGVAEDEYTQLIQAADQLKVNLIIEGELPEEETQKHITATALHEFLTNTIRHAQSNEVFVSVIELENDYQIELMNRGVLPDEEVVEQGGLKSLRTLIEQIGGEMMIEVNDCFLITMIIPKEVSRE